MLIPPKEYYPGQNCLWRLKRAMYGLKQAPALWQQHFCSTMLKLGMRRCKADPNLYCHPSGDLYVLCYVDDLLVCGKHQLAVQFTKDLEKEVLLKIEAELKPGKSVNFLGRVLRHNGDSVDICMPQDYITKTLDLYNMVKAKAVGTTGTTSFSHRLVLGDPLSADEHKVYRTAVGKLLWLALIRPDTSYATKELSRDLTAPTNRSLLKLKHLLGYLAGTKDYVHRLRAGITLSSNKCTFDLDCFVDSDWAGCQRTRKSTSGVVVKLLNCPVDSCARTQGTIALSSGEAKLYAIGQGISETLHVRNLILDAELAKKVKLHIYTGSTAGKSMATRFGSGKKTKQFSLFWFVFSNYTGTVSPRLCGNSLW